MRIQIHHQKKTDNIETTMCVECEDYQRRPVFEETKKTHPLPEDCIWMFCDEESVYFKR